MLDVFKVIAPEFANNDDDSIQTYIDLADSEVALDNAQRERIIVYLAAHYMTLALKRKGAGGEVVSLSEGKLSIQYANSKAVDDLDTTSYGRTYKRLVKKYFISPIIV